MYKLSAVLFSIFLSCVTPLSVMAQEVTVSGECVGVRMYTDGLIITDTATLTQTDGKKINLASGYGIKKGDIIKEVNGTKPTDVKVVSDAVKNGDATLLIMRNGEEYTITVTPVLTKDGAKLGLWLRDSTAGLGTITCSINNRFVGLGHGICDIDTGNIMPVRYGIIQNCSQFSTIKGQKGSPGAITGKIDGETLGKISGNTHYGISGTISSPSEGKDMETADKSEVVTGDASILCDIDGNGVKEYTITIKRIMLNQPDGKDLIIKVTDKDLISKTGGIVQGMSGSPIIQKGKLVGAVTHVFVNDPQKGYGVFIENMLEEIE